MAILAHNRQIVDNVDKGLSTPPNSASRITLNALAADYAAKHGVTLDILKRWQWEPVLYQQRPALKFETLTGPRYRFLDGQEPRFKHKFGYKSSWYGVDNALKEFVSDGNVFVICNGEGSTVTAQTHFVPAASITSGEKSAIPQNLFDELKQWLAPGTKIIVAFDCDETGRKKGPLMAAQLVEAGYDAWAVDLELGDKGDLADFCMLHDSKAYTQLLECPHLDMPVQTQPAFTPRVVAAAHTSKLANLSPDAEAKRENWFKKTWDGIVRKVATTTSGRYDVVWWGGRKLLDLVDAGYRSEAEALRALENACEDNGYRTDNGRGAVESQWRGAQNATRATVDVPEFHDNPAPRRQYSAHADNSPESDTVHSDANVGIVAAVRPAQLPSNMIKRGIKVLGWPIVMEIQYLLYVMALGVLPSFFTFKGRNAGENTPPADKNVYTEMLDMGILIEVSSELILSMLYILKDTWGNEGIKSRGRKEKVYQLASLAELTRIMFTLMSRSLVAETVESDELPTIDESVYPLARYVLEKLLNWKTPLESIGVDLVRHCLKKADKYCAEEVLEAIRWQQITDASLIEAMKLQVAQCVADAHVKQADEVTAGLIDLKNRLLKKMYESHKKALKSPVTTPLPDNAPRAGQEGLKAFYNALIKPYNGAYLWTHELSKIMGIEDDDTAKRHAKNAGVIIGETRFEARAFTVEVKHDYTPTWEEVLIVAKQAIKHEDKALDGRLRVWGPSYMHSVIRSYDDAGCLVGKGRVTEADEPDDWRVGGTHFTVELELRPLITVLEVAPLADAIQADEMPETAANAAEKAEQTPAQDEAKETASRGRRITPDRLRDDDWMLRRFIASFCFNAKAGVFYNPLTGEMHETQQAAIDDILSTIKPSQLKAVS